MANKLTNGEKPHSVTVDHLFQYPLLSQSFDFYQKQPLGAKSLNIANDIYSRTSPYLATPASYIAPYASKVDGLVDATLDNVDNYVPAFKNTDFHTLHSYATFPVRYARDTYSDEYRKTTRRDGEGVISFGKAVLSTEFRIASESLQYVASILGPKKDQAADQYEQLKASGSEKAQNLKNFTAQKADDLSGAAQNFKEQYGGEAKQKADEVAGQAQSKKDEVAGTAQQKKNEYASAGQQKSEQAKGTAQQKKEQLVNGN